MNTRLVDCHLFDFQVPIYSALIAVASQENHDGPEDDLMIRAAEYIRVLEGLVDLIENGRDECDFMDCDSWILRQDDPGIARQSADLWNNL